MPNTRYRLIFRGIILVSIIFIAILYISVSKNDFVRIIKLPWYLNQTSEDQSLPRVLCLILTTPQYFLSRAKAVNDTWAPRCDHYFFVTEYPPNNTSSEMLNFTKHIPILSAQNTTHGYNHLTQKSILAFKFAYEQYFNKIDWVVKADDDTYISVSHLKMFLRDKNTSDPVTFGYNMKVRLPKGFHSGGASYVLSREALRRFYEAHNVSNTTCGKDGFDEDVKTAACLASKGVYPGKSLDEQNRELFHPLSYTDHFHGRFPDWLTWLAENPLRSHYGCCSDRSISFHYVHPDTQYLMDYLLYRTHSTSNIKRNK